MATTATGTSGNDTLNGGSGADSISGGAGNDRISGGSGDDTLNGGSGSDIVNGDSGNDTLIYVVAENVNATDVYTGGSGVDTVRLMLTGTEWLSSSVQSQIGQYLLHLAAYTNAKTGEVSNGSASDFKFAFGTSTLTVQMIEKLDVWVDGHQIDFHVPVVNPTGTDAAGAATEDVGVVGGLLMDSGTIAFYDVDFNQTHTVEVAPIANALGGTLSATLTNAATGDGQGVVSWSYQVDDNSPHIQGLAAGQSVQETFSVTIKDGSGNSVAQTVTVTVTGTNDAPVITNTAAALLGAVQEDTTLQATGQLSASDVDHGATQSWSVQGSASGSYGSMGVDAATGQWTYTLDNAAHQDLAAGESHDELFTIRVTDDQGAYVDQQVKVTVTGTNDAPTGSATAALADGQQNNPYMFSESALLQGFSDVDHNATLHVAGLTADHGTIIDNHDGTFTLTPQAGYSGVMGLTYQVTDGAGGSVGASESIDFIASNHAPVAGADTIVVSNQTSNVTISAAALLGNDSDVDGNTLSIVSVGNASAGISGLSLSGGKITFSTGNFTADQSFTYTLSDGVTTTVGSVTAKMVSTANGTGQPDTVNLAQAQYSGYVASYIDLQGGSDTASGGGSAIDTFLGAKGSDALTGGAGGDVLNGGLDADTLTGGAGNDTFVFDSALGGGNVDTVSDFKSGGDADKIALSHAIFSNLVTSSGTLGASDFGSVSNGTGATATSFASGVHIIYDSQTGNLFYDSDGGNTASGRTLFATLNSGAGHPAVGVGDIIVGP